MAVHNVQMQPVGSGSISALCFTSKATEIGGQQ
jgi:hypothetical protein